MSPTKLTQQIGGAEHRIRIRRNGDDNLNKTTEQTDGWACAPQADNNGNVAKKESGEHLKMRPLESVTNRITGYVKHRFKRSSTLVTLDNQNECVQGTYQKRKSIQRIQARQKSTHQSTNCDKRNLAFMAQCWAEMGRQLAYLACRKEQKLEINMEAEQAVYEIHISP